MNVWTTPTAILYGANDDICEISILKDFADEFGCDLKVMEDAEHYFHTAEQLEYFKQWVEGVIQ